MTQPLRLSKVDSELPLNQPASLVLYKQLLDLVAHSVSPVPNKHANLHRAAPILRFPGAPQALECPLLDALQVTVHLHLKELLPLRFHMPLNGGKLCHLIGKG
jgi:hypothetical protein